VHEVVPAVDLEAEDAVALQLTVGVAGLVDVGVAGLGVEARVGDPAEDAEQREDGARDEAVELRGMTALAAVVVRAVSGGDRARPGHG